jgi:hypothetical protein
MDISMTADNVVSSAEEMRTFVHEQFARDPNCVEARISSGFRVKFGRPLDPSETALMNAAYAEADGERSARHATEAAEAEARAPKGLLKVLLTIWSTILLILNPILRVIFGVGGGRSRG